MLSTLPTRAVGGFSSVGANPGGLHPYISGMTRVPSRHDFVEGWDSKPSGFPQAAETWKLGLRHRPNLLFATRAVGLSQSPIAQSAGPLQALASLRRRGLEYISGGDAWVKSWAGSVSLSLTSRKGLGTKPFPRDVGSSKGSAHLDLYFPYAPYGAGAMYLPPTAYGKDIPED